MMAPGTVVIHKPMRGQVNLAVVAEPEILGLGYVYILINGRMRIAHEDDLVTCASDVDARQLFRAMADY